MSELCELVSYLNCSLKPWCQVHFPCRQINFAQSWSSSLSPYLFSQVRKRHGSALLVDKQLKRKCAVESEHLLSRIMIDGMLSDWLFFPPPVCVAYKPEDWRRTNLVHRSRSFSLCPQKDASQEDRRSSSLVSNQMGKKMRRNEGQGDLGETTLSRSLHAVSVSQRIVGLWSLLSVRIS